MRDFDNSWLRRRVSLEELGADWGLMQAEWAAFRAQMKDGDELWKYAHGSDLACEIGIALKRGEYVIAKIVTIQS
jgi:hypothetical protein